MLAVLALLGWLMSSVSTGQTPQSAAVRVDLASRLGPLHIERMSLGQGGLSPEPMWEDRAAEVRSLRPAVIRLFIQEYYRLEPSPGHYDFRTLDRSVNTILRTGAMPLMCICFKPGTLFPKIDQDIVEPTDYIAWERLVAALVEHYRKRGAGIKYWEVANEPDIGEDGGCPYRFRPESYVRYYRHTTAAVLRADPEARVGGPALAGYQSDILPALLKACERENLPLHFVSWHAYTSDPGHVRRTIDFVHDLLKKYPSLHPETVLDEWNMDLQNPPKDPAFQPCYVLETIRQMKDAGLDWSCYYHIKDYQVEYDTFAPFMSPGGAAFMTRWWNRMPQFDGLFDYQNTVRPAFFAFKLLSRLTGERLKATSDDPRVHALATHDEKYRIANVLVWNFSAEPVAVSLHLEGIPEDRLLRSVTLDAHTASGDENARLRPDPPFRVAKGNHEITLRLEPYGVRFWSLE